ncbi:MAG: ATP-binding protein [Bacteroidales bacterium]|nr:ATP-binding protein [Bacteroidales bacterium]
MELLKIRHFGPVKDLSVEILPLTVFIGTQGCGKSTVSKVLTICRDMSWILRLLNAAENLKAPFAKFCIDEFFYDDTVIRYEAENEIAHYVITYEKGEFGIDVREISREEMAVKIHSFLLLSNQTLLTQLGVTDINDASVQEKYGEIINSNARTILYVPAERNLAGSLSTSLASMLAARVPLYDALIEYMSVFEKAKNALREYHVPFLNADFVIKDGKERIRVVDSYDGTERLLPLQACSSGLQSVLPLVMVIDYALQIGCFDAFVIEEPEQNLYPTNQRELIQFLLNRIGRITNTIITTHSPYILSCLNVMLLAWRIVNEFQDGKEALQEVYQGVYFNERTISVYALDPDADIYCKNLIDEKTHLIGINGLDAVSEVIGDDYDSLYRLYLKLKRGK